MANMSKYFKLFDTHSEYEAYTADTSNFILPNVSYCEDVENEVHYNPYIDPYNGHEYVDLGLPSGIKWATMNIGANNATDVGFYVQWGDISGYTTSQVGSGDGQKCFNWSTYKYCDGTDSNITKYNSTDGKMELDISDDTARANWGGLWRIPTDMEYSELLSNTTSAFTNDCLVLTSIANGNTITLPCGWNADNCRVDKWGTAGYYWTRSLVYANRKNGFNFKFGSNDITIAGSYVRCLGFSVRAVVDE